MTNSVLKSWLPKGDGENLFQGIKRVKLEAETQGVKCFDLGVGEPQGAAIQSAKDVASTAVLSMSKLMHGYQDNGEPGVSGFAESFVRANVGDTVDWSAVSEKDMECFPIPGIKSMIGLIPLACGSFIRGPGRIFEEGKLPYPTLRIMGMTDPGYPVSQTWSEQYLGNEYRSLTTDPENDFLISADEVNELCPNLLMLNYPNNPSGQISIEFLWDKLLPVCVEKGIRVFNDAAYAMLDHSGRHITLAEAALKYPGLSWVEAYSASKVIGNGTGWRVGAMAGSPDFIADIKTIKGNTDSGFNAALATGVKYTVENDMDSIEMVRETYSHRIEVLKDILHFHGLRLATDPKAGFFTLWQVPRRAFGQDIRDAKHFNYLMIEKTGLIGVHFHPYIRYAVVADIEQSEFIRAINNGFEMAKVGY